jgi:hypothetical protein
VEISTQLKTLEQERREIDAELLEVFSDAELRFGWLTDTSHPRESRDSQLQRLPVS